ASARRPGESRLIAKPAAMEKLPARPLEVPHEGPLPQTPAQESQEGDARLAGSDDRLLRPRREPGQQGRRRHRCVRARGGRRDDWKLDAGDVRNDPRIAEEMLEFMARHGVLSVAMTDRIIGCPHQEGIDYQGEWCPVCEFWKGRDRFTGERVH